MVDPRKLPRASYDSQATASDATVDDEKLERYRDDTSPDVSSIYPPKRTSSRYNAHADDLEDGLGVRLDDDEQVGLMQDDRDGRARRRREPAWTRLATSNKRPSVFAGCSIFIGVVLGFMLALPLLQWLSSNTTASPASSTASSAVKSPANSASAPSSETASSTPSIWKQPSSPDTLAGHYALANTSTFQVDFQDSGWNTYVQASLGTGLSEAEVSGSKTHDGHDLMPLDMDTVFGGTLAPQTSDLTWSEEDPDEGVFSHVDWAKRDIWLEDVTHARHHKTGTGKVAPFGGKVLVVEGKNVLDGKGRMLDWTTFKFSPDLRWVLFFSSETGQWRYSKKSHLWLHNIATKKTTSLGSGPEEPPKVSFAAWAPNKPATNTQNPPSIAFVEDNNLYFIPRAGDDPVKVTDDGATTIFNAVPDWVYEEEVYGSDSVMWFSPGGSKLVYLRLDETTVPVYEFPVYNPDPYRAGFTAPYQKMTKMKYPKPGFPNPIVSVKMIDLDEIREATRKGVTVRPTQYTLHSPMSNKGKADNEIDRLLSTDAGVKERLVTEVKWVSDNELLVRETDRYSDVMRIVNFDLSNKARVNAAGVDVVGQVVRRQDARADKSGWIRAAQTIEPLSHHNLSVGSTAYLDIVVSQAGYRHLAYYDSATSDKPIFLTSGKWEIADLKHVDAKRGRAYFVAARPTPALRNVYFVELPDWKKVPSRGPSTPATYTVKEPVALTDVSKPGSYDVSFDPKGAYYVLNYQGPDVPYQKVVGVDDPNFELMLEENKMLRQLSSQYVKPSNTFYQLVLNATMPDGSKAVASVKEIRPHDFDPSGATKYPVLVRVYGGPDSQLVDARWNRADWHQYVASTLGYIVVVVDGRGTGFKGQAYRASVAGNLGDLEAKDVNEASKLISTLPYVDETRIGLWGWSYGGFLTGKSVELDQNIFSLAVSVAPVTKWEFYDSVYTERYMKSPATNARGYDTASIHVNSAFSKTKYLLMQGSADDNVHYSNSAHLLDLLTKAKVRGFRFRMFTDSAHNISTRGAYRELFEEMTAFLRDIWGPGGKREPAKDVKKGKNRPSLHNSVERSREEQ
ncbi:related to dipeptidyl aminopeptidase [Ustilago trichophora]|uniref:Related to dipeptidyl aminopeptidase n=1 Tax=Ustilago trichophora TaxID=86804 RepID=A0A5C3EI36_9BASI|nr:related to dipeptidyl aminopeptidase [Ustilago trichophora]